MVEHANRPPLIYINLDAQGIESLYAQITNRAEIELVETRSRQGRGEVGLNIGFGNLLSSLLGLKEAAAETRLEELRGHIEEAKTKLTVEHKVQRLSDYLVSAKMCFDNLQGAVSSSSELGKVLYVRSLERFDVPDFCPGRGGVAEINSSEAVVFTIGREYDPSDSYFKHGHLHFVMAASLKKFTRLNGYMGATSHEAIMFRKFSGKNIPLGFFGSLMRSSNIACQIKPFAIWLQNDF